MSELNFTHSNGNKVKLTTPDTLSANRTFKLPGADGTSGQAMVTDGNGAFSFASMPSVAGITMMDMWRITNDNNVTGDADIGSHWERADTFFAQIGSGMSESSGVFTFPQTGIYLIMVQAATYGNGHSYAGFFTQVSTDSGGSYSNFTYCYGNHRGGSGYNNLFVNGILDVTNASTFRMKMRAHTPGNLQFSGDSNAHRTGITFIRLGDT